MWFLFWTYWIAGVAMLALGMPIFALIFFSIALTITIVS